MPPEIIGRYSVIRELGRGAMGVVYEAADPNLARHVALKTIHANAIGTNPEEAALRFKNEARAAGSLNHPNIVTVFDAGEQDGLLYLAMELLEGETLDAHLAQRRTIPLEQAIDITRQICSALDYAHGKGIVHRDIKPANIILLPNGTVKITDFGLARTAEAITMTGHVMGTPHYMSPEQVRGRPVDGRSDLFSVGVMLYEIVTGERPFEGQSITTIMYKIVHENPTPPRALDSTIPPGLSAVIEQSIAKSPEDRFQTGAALVHALENYRSAEAINRTSTGTIEQAPPAVGVPATTPTLPTPLATPSTKPPSRTIRNLVIAFVCIAIVIFALIFLPRHGKPKAEEAASQSSSQEQSPAAPPAPSAPVPDDTAQTNPEKTVPPPTVVQKQPSTPGTSTATISVKSNPPTAAILVDNKPTGMQTPAQLQLTRGEHTISVHMDGFQTASTKVHVNGGEQLEFAPELKVQLPDVPGVNVPQVSIPGVDLKELEQLQHGNTGNAAFWQQWAKAAEQNAQEGAQQPAILVNTRPSGAHIFIDGNDTGKISPAVIPTQPGGHEIRLELDGYKPTERQVEVKARQPAMVNIRLNAVSDAKQQR